MGARLPKILHLLAGNSVRRGASLTFAYLALAVAFTWPLASGLDSLVLSARFDSWGSLWGATWFSSHFPGAPGSLVSPLLGHPFGIQLELFDSWGWALLSWLAVRFTGPLLALNLVTLAGLVLTGLLQYRLARRLDLSPLAAFLSGGVLAFSSATSNTLLEGSGYLTFIGCVPLYVHGLLDLVERGGTKNQLKAGLAMALASYSSGYLGLLCVLLTPVVALWRWRRGATAKLALRIGVLAALCALLLLPLLMAHTTQSAPAEIFHTGGRVKATEVTAMDLAAPTANLLALPRAPGDELAISSLYLGYAVLCFCLVALVRIPARRTVPLLATATLFILISLGPVPLLSRSHDMEEVSKIKREAWSTYYPVAWIYKLPVLSRVRFPVRLAIPGLMATALLAGLGLDALRRMEHGRKLALLLGGVALLEGLSLAGRPMPKPTQTWRMPAELAVLTRDRTPGAVLDLIPNVPNMAEPLLGWQVTHGRPLVYPGLFHSHTQAFALYNKLLWSRLGHQHSGGSWGVGQERLRGLLNRSGIRYIVLHEYQVRQNLFNHRMSHYNSIPHDLVTWLPQRPAAALRTLLDREMVRVAGEDGIRAVYRVPGEARKLPGGKPLHLTPVQSWRLWQGEHLPVLERVLAPPRP